MLVIDEIRKLTIQLIKWQIDETTTMKSVIRRSTIDILSSYYRSAPITAATTADFSVTRI